MLVQIYLYPKQKCQEMSYYKCIVRAVWNHFSVLVNSAQPSVTKHLAALMYLSMSFSSAETFLWLFPEAGSQTLSFFFFWKADILYHLPVSHKIRLWLKAAQWNLYKKKYSYQAKDFKTKNLWRQLEDTQGKIIIWSLGLGFFLV